MRLARLQEFLTEKALKHTYSESDGLGSIDFEHLGLRYHIWEFKEGDEYGVESNVANAGRTCDYTGDYQNELMEIMKNW